MKIRKAKVKDINPLYNLMNSAKELSPAGSRNFFPTWYIKARIENPIVYFIVAEENNKIIGMLDAEIWKKERYSEFSTIAVWKKFRRRGVGTLLFENYIKFIKKTRINYIVSITNFNNSKMQKFFKKHGFHRRELLYFYDKELK